MKYQVLLIESEAGRGQRIDEKREFDSLEEANKFVKDFNAKNNKKRVPAWYMYATEPTPV